MHLFRHTSPRITVRVASGSMKAFLLGRRIRRLLENNHNDHAEVDNSNDAAINCMSYSNE